MQNPVAALVILSSVMAASPSLSENPPLPRPRPVERADTAPAPAARVSPPDWTRAAPVPAVVPNPVLPEKPVAPPAPLQRACPAVLVGNVVAKMLPPIAEGQCGADSPLAVSAILVNGRLVDVTGEIVTDCGMATKLVDWVTDVDRYVAVTLEAPVASVEIGTSYMCRPVNSLAGNKLSFHAIANALDIIGFTLADGRKLTVTGDFRNLTSPEGKATRFAHAAACGHFTTVLGPDADAEHADHLHVDLGCHGKTCTARICQ